MTTPVTASTAPATPPPLHSSVKDEANQSLAQIKAGHDPLRPVRYVSKFIGGTVMAGLNGLADWARRGMFAGGGIGAIVGIALGGAAGLITVAIMGAAIGFAAGAVVGGAVGVATGGMKEVNRQRRGEKYADDLVERDKVQKNAPSRNADYRAYHREKQLQNNYVLEQILQREKEIRRDTYWQDREAHHNSGHTRGF